jgi:hypothetical protein
LTELNIDGFSLDILGFTQDEIDALMNGSDVPESSSIEVDVDDFHMGAKCPRCGFEFDPKSGAHHDDEPADEE